MKKRYLSEAIGDEYKQWNKEKIIITAPTGMGKSTFIIKTLLPYLRERNRKLLILCNRKLLRLQYWNELILQFDNYIDLQKSVTVMTYQQLAQDVRNLTSVDDLFYDYHTIVCDETHYFYSDSDFNAFGTYSLLQIIAYAGIGKSIIFMSATTEEVKPLIERTIQNCITKFRRTRDNWRFDESCGKIIVRDFSGCDDYNRFNCICVPDENTLLGIIADSDKKSIIFIDRKEKGASLKEKLIQKYALNSNDIALLNADNIDDDCNSLVVRNLAISHRLVSKILITTSVLDNGVSIHDPEVGNMVIVTESKLSFIQMLGRVRSENVDTCNLYFMQRTECAFINRMKRYQTECEYFENLKQANLKFNEFYYHRVVWDNSDVTMADFYRKSLVLMEHEYQCFVLSESKFGFAYGYEGLYINEFAKQKIGDMYLMESRLYSLACSNPLNVIYEQLRWIGKEAAELTIQESTYIRDRKEKFIEYLLTVQNFSQTELQDFKKALTKEYRKDFFPNILANNGTISTKKLQLICEQFGLQLKVINNSMGRKKTYSITTHN